MTTKGHWKEAHGEKKLSIAIILVLFHWELKTAHASQCLSWCEPGNELFRATEYSNSPKLLSLWVHLNQDWNTELLLASHMEDPLLTVFCEMVACERSAVKISKNCLHFCKGLPSHHHYPFIFPPFILSKHRRKLHRKEMPFLHIAMGQFHPSQFLFYLNLTHPQPLKVVFSRTKKLWICHQCITNTACYRGRALQLVGNHSIPYEVGY